MFSSFSLCGSVMAQITTTQSDPNGNHDSGYAPSNIEDILAATVTPPASPHQATIFVNKNVHYKTKNGSAATATTTTTNKTLQPNASPKKEPFR
jgi:dopamine receptor D2